jgi:hypothetical protein
MIRTHITPLTANISLMIPIPTNYVGKRIEVVLYADDEIKEVTTELPKIKLSDKYRGSITKEQGQQLNEHIKQMRNEWNSI